MILNHKKVPVWKWNEKDESLCPDCNGKLLPRKGEFKIWHWAHYPGRTTSNCWSEESMWHLAMKMAYYVFDNWEIEVPLTVNGYKYRIDAANPNTGKLREFVHSLSPRYTDKHYQLSISGFDVLWIYNGLEFVSARRKEVNLGGIKRILKPKAHDLYRYTGGLVHHDGQLWKEWKNDVWYPSNGKAALSILSQFEYYYKDRNS